MLRAYLIRHGESTANREGVYAGDTDVPLTETGRRQALALAARLASVPLAAVVASDLQRAVRTAEAIAAGRGLSVAVDPRWRELDLGLWEGRTHDAVVREDPEAFARWLEGGDDAAAPGGETWAAMTARVSAAWEEWRRRIGAGAIAFVTHTGPIRAMVARALALDRIRARRLQVDTASITVLDWGEEGPRVVTLNDTAHLMCPGLWAPAARRPGQG